MHPSEVKLIVIEQIKTHYDDLEKKLPKIMEPSLHQMAKDVVDDAMARFCYLFNIDTHNVESIRELQKDMNFTRDCRQTSERNRNIIRHTFITIILGALITSALVWFGLNIQ